MTFEDVIIHNIYFSRLYVPLLRDMKFEALHLFLPAKITSNKIFTFLEQVHEDFTTLLTNPHHLNIAKIGKN